MNDLKLVIEAFIRENGGANALAENIEAEWCKSFIPHVRKWTHEDKIFLLKNYNHRTCDYISKRLNRTYEATRKQVENLRNKAIIDFRKYKQ